MFARHKVAANLAMVLMVMAGIWVLTQLNVQLNPPRDHSRASVGIVWRGARAEDVEKLITVPLEQQLRMRPGVKTLRSTTRVTSTSVQGGTVGQGQIVRQLRGLDQQRDTLGFNELQFADRNGHLVRPGDIAEITRRPRMPRSCSPRWSGSCRVATAHCPVVGILAAGRPT